MAIDLKGLVIRFQKFLLIGVIGLVINVAGLYLLTEYLEIYYVLSSFVAVEVSLVVTFTFNELWTWGDRSPGTVVRRFWKYQLVNGVGLGINVSTLFLIASLLGVHYMLANLVGAGLAAFWNFALNNVFTWGDLGGSTNPGSFGDARKPSPHEA